ncbi:MAG: hypothetical protein AB7Q17_09030 [Phycisphaerae bacterium]
MEPHAALALFVLFAEPEFPKVDVAELARVDGAIEARSVAELSAALQPGRVLVWRHGSGFPDELWEPLVRFLDAGGSMLYVGGQPFLHRVTGEPGRRTVEPPTVTLLRALRLNQVYRVPVRGARMAPARMPGGGHYVSGADDTEGRVGGRAAPRVFERPLSEDRRVAFLEPRFCDTKDFSDEDGSPGARDAVLRPLAHVFDDSADSAGGGRASNDRMNVFATASAAVAIDRLRGRWSGGRWVFWLLSEPPTEGELRALLAEAARPAVDFRADPTFGCFHAGEQPSVTLRLHRPRARDARDFCVRIRVTRDGERIHALDGVALRATEHGDARIALPIDSRPGLYRVRAWADDLPVAETGFWVFDDALFRSGDALTFDESTLLRNGVPEPVVGTTVMSATVHRDFLFEPNAAVWDDTFAELRAAKINLVRTGVWSGYRKIMLDPGVVDEAWLRALEAYYLTARRHGIPVVFTFFAFLPETFGGQNPYFDARAREAQRAYVSAVARRFADAREMLWDLINEPSFSSPKQLWLCRPNGDDAERRAFEAWLAARFARAAGGDAAQVAGGDPAPPRDWRDVVRRRWRLTADEPIGLPALDDFNDRAVFGANRPYRAADYVLFAQESFGDWAREMRAAIRAAGSRATITVGQDEGGALLRPGPLFHHESIDYTSMHTWWFNDALLWDALMAKAPRKPLLISETGVMQRELLSGEAHRTPDDAARLLSRKIGYAFAGRAFGVVQWCYDVNPYMASDNEVAIGLRRVDGSYKPEHRVLRNFAAFVACHREKFVQPRPAEVVLISPSWEVFSPRDHATTATRRAVDVLVRELGVSVQMVAEPRVELDLGDPRAIILPANRGVSEATWRALKARVAAGATLLCDGWFECDEAATPAARIGSHRRPLALAEPLTFWSGGAGLATGGAGIAKSGETERAAAQQSRIARFSAAIAESCFAATTRGASRADSSSAAAQPRRETLGEGTIWHHPLPLEWSDATDALRAFYADGLSLVDIQADEACAAAARQGVTLCKLRFRDAVLIVAVNESSLDATIEVNQRGATLSVPAGEARLAWLSADEASIVDASPTGF